LGPLGFGFSGQNQVNPQPQGPRIGPNSNSSGQDRWVGFGSLGPVWSQAAGGQEGRQAPIIIFQRQRSGNQVKIPKGPSALQRHKQSAATPVRFAQIIVGPEKAFGQGIRPAIEEPIYGKVAQSRQTGSVVAGPYQGHRQLAAGIFGQRASFPGRKFPETVFNAPSQSRVSFSLRQTLVASMPP